MQRMSAQDASFLHIETDNSPMHVGGVSIFEGPPPPFAERPRRGVAASSPWCRATARWCGSCRSALAVRCGSTTHTSTSATTSAARRSRPRRRRRTADAGRPGDVAEPRPRQAAVGDVGRRGSRGRALGAAVEGSSLHGRRGRQHRSDGGAARHRARPGAARRPRRLGAGPRCRASAVARRGARSSKRGARSPSRERFAGALTCAARSSRRCSRTPSRGLIGVGGRGAAPPAVVAQRPAGPAPPLGLGARTAVGRPAGPAARSAAPSTTSCWRRSPAAFASCC